MIGLPFDSFFLTGFSESEETAPPNQVAYLRQAVYQNVFYIGKAAGGALESSPRWKITRGTVSLAGSVQVATATGVAWSNHLTAVYS